MEGSQGCGQMDILDKQWAVGQREYRMHVHYGCNVLDAQSTLDDGSASAPTAVCWMSDVDRW